MLTHARITAVALLGAAALLTAGCGGDDKADEAREQASSAMSQAQEAQSQALSQAERGAVAGGVAARRPHAGPGRADRGRAARHRDDRRER